jgi:hypothetical protein
MREHKYTKLIQDGLSSLQCFYHVALEYEPVTHGMKLLQLYT